MGVGQCPVQGKGGSEQSTRWNWVAPESLPALSLRFCIGKHAEPTETDVPHSPPAHSLLRAPGASHPSRASHLPRGTCHSPSRPPHRPAEEAVIPDAESASQPAGHQEHDAIHRGARGLSRRAQRATRLHRVFRLPLNMHCAPVWTCPSPATIPAITGPPNHPANPQECPAHLQRASDQPRRARRARRSRGLSLRGSPHLTQWLNNIFTLPLSCVAPQRDASVRGYRAGGRALQTLGAGVFPQDSDSTPLENPQIQVLPLCPPENPLTSPDTTHTSL